MMLQDAEMYNTVAAPQRAHASVRRTSQQIEVDRLCLCLTMLTADGDSPSA